MSECNKVYKEIHKKYSTDKKQQIEFICLVDISNKKLLNRETIEKSTELSTIVRILEVGT